MRKFLIGLFLGCTLSAGAALAVEAPSVAADPLLEKRVLSLSEQLRCLVCQNQTIAESHADLAIDLKNQVREQLGQGRSEQQVVDYMVQRYGDFVMYRPPFKAITWLLWLGPLLLLLGGIATLVLQLRRRSDAEPELPETELARAASLLTSLTPLTPLTPTKDQP